MIFSISDKSYTFRVLVYSHSKIIISKKKRKILLIENKTIVIFFIDDKKKQFIMFNTNNSIKIKQVI